MTALQELFSAWFDPRFVGEIVVTWSGRLLAAAAIVLIGRLFLRALTRWSTGTIAAEQRPLPVANLTAGK